MKRLFILMLMGVVAISLSGCSDQDREEAATSQLTGKTLPLTNSVLILDLVKDHSISKSPTANALGLGLSFDTLTGCTGCNYYQGGTFRKLLSPGSQITLSSAYKAVPARGSINSTAVTYFVIQSTDGEKFTLPEYEVESITGGSAQKVRPEAMLFERVLAEYTDPTQPRQLFLKVQPNWLKQGHPELVPPYSSEAVAAYFNPLIAGLKAGSFSELEIHPEEFFISLKANKAALAQIMLYTEGLKFDIIPAYGLSVAEPQITPVIPTP